MVKRKYVQNTLPVMAAGEELPIVDHVTVHITLNCVDHVHDFPVVAKLITAAILGIDFLYQQGPLLDFRTTVLSPTIADAMKAEVDNHEKEEVLLKPFLENSHRSRDKTCSATGVDDDVNNDMVEECAISFFSDLVAIEPPQYVQQYFEAVAREFGDIFSTQTDRTNMASHLYECQLGEFQFTSVIYMRRAKPVSYQFNMFAGLYSR